MPLSRADILASLERRELLYDWPLMGGAVLIRELLRVEFAAAEAFALTGDINPATGAKLMDLWRWHAAVVAAGLMDPGSGRPFDPERRDPASGAILVDPATRTPMFTADEVNHWPNRDGVEAGLAELAQIILDVSEVADPKALPGSSAS